MIIAALKMRCYCNSNDEPEIKKLMKSLEGVEWLATVDDHKMHIIAHRNEEIRLRNQERATPAYKSNPNNDAFINNEVAYQPPSAFFEMSTPSTTEQTF